MYKTTSNILSELQNLVERQGFHLNNITVDLFFLNFRHCQLNIISSLNIYWITAERFAIIQRMDDFSILSRSFFCVNNFLFYSTRATTDAWTMNSSCKHMKGELQMKYSVICENGHCCVGKGYDSNNNAETFCIGNSFEPYCNTYPCQKSYTDPESFDRRSRYESFKNTNIC